MHVGYLYIYINVFLLVFVCCLQGEALGFSIWRGDEVYLCKVLWLPAAAEGEQFYCLNRTLCVKSNFKTFHQTASFWGQFKYCKKR